MNTIRPSILLAVALSAFFIAGCVQLPTERQGAVDQRPQITFKVNPSVQAAGARVLVDGLDVGGLDSLREDVASLRVLPGTHLVQVSNGARILFEERVFVSDGARRTLLINAGGAR